MQRLLILAPFLLPACAGEAVGPSLAKRPVENGTMADPVREVAAPAPAGANLRNQIAGLVTRAKAGDSAFAALLPKARSAAAGAGAEGSESWIAAQQLLSALEEARAPTTQSLSELDALVTARLNNGEEGLVELQAADAEVAGLVESQQRTFDSLRGQISR